MPRLNTFRLLAFVSVAVLGYYYLGAENKSPVGLHRRAPTDSIRASSAFQTLIVPNVVSDAFVMGSQASTGNVILSTERQLVAYDNSGKQVWSTPVEGALKNRRLKINAGTGEIYLTGSVQEGGNCVNHLIKFSNDGKRQGETMWTLYERTGCRVIADLQTSENQLMAVSYHGCPTTDPCPYGIDLLRLNVATLAEVSKADYYEVGALEGFVAGSTSSEFYAYAVFPSGTPRNVYRLTPDGRELWTTDVLVPSHSIGWSDAEKRVYLASSTTTVNGKLVSYTRTSLGEVGGPRFEDQLMFELPLVAAGDQVTVQQVTIGSNGERFLCGTAGTKLFARRSAATGPAGDDLFVPEGPAECVDVKIAGNTAYVGTMMGGRPTLAIVNTESKNGQVSVVGDTAAPAPGSNNGGSNNNNGGTPKTSAGAILAASNMPLMLAALFSILGFF